MSQDSNRLVKNVHFNKRKYGPELLIDVAWINEMPSFEKSPKPYRIDFYDITLIKRGKGIFWLDNTEHPLKNNRVLFTTPGQVRQWQVNDLDGVCLFFPSEFLLEHFNDSLFLHRLRYFHAHAGPFYLDLTQQQATKLLERLTSMHGEIDNLMPDSPHMLRAIAYEILVNLNRWFASSHGQILDAANDHTVTRFRQLIEQEVYHKLSVQDYASLLNITPGHLNYLCKSHLGKTASELISTRLLSEAQRLLLHSTLDINQVSQQLGFKDPSYFSRYFKRQHHCSPLTYRTAAKSKHEF